jgi:hypothetical protein
MRMMTYLFNKKFKEAKKPRKSSGIRYKLTDDQELEIFNYFKSNKDNRISVMAKVFNVSKFKINAVLDKYI